ncbi:aldehyde dehydrogenase family protein [Caproiciproducens sp.]
MILNEDTVKFITEQVLQALDRPQISAGQGIGEKKEIANGIFDSAEEAVEAAYGAFKEMLAMTLEQREEMIEAIRAEFKDQIETLARMELDETLMGRLEDKVRKISWAITDTPGIEDIRPEVFSGDYGLTLVEHMPFGVANCILPSTAPVATVIHNSICMIAAGNSVVISPHPGALKTTLRAVELVNQAVSSVGGPKNLIASPSKITMEISKKMMTHPKVSLLMATGGPGVVKAVLSSGKKAIGAGPGNPPVLVDETADIANAARCILAGNMFDYGLQCICEKEIVVVDSVADRLIEELRKNGAYFIEDKETIERLSKMVTNEDGSINRKYVGRAPWIILKDLGISADPSAKSIIYEAPRDHITVTEEYLMPLLPIVRAKDVAEAIALSVNYEGGRRHTAIMHSKNIDNMSTFAKAVSTTIFVKNGPSFAGVGMGGEGHMTLSIAGPTGEGLTVPRTFTRRQCCALIGSFNMRSQNKLADLWK